MAHHGRSFNTEIAMFSHLVGGGKALITDPYFYAVTIPAVLLLGIIVGALLFKLLNAHTVCGHRRYLYLAVSGAAPGVSAQAR